MNQRPQPNNRRQTACAERAVRHYSRTSGYENELDYETDTVDLLTDLRHFCASVGLDFTQLNETARRHYEAEAEEEMSRCNNCQRVWRTEELKPVVDMAERVSPGEIVPSGQCPGCGASCHLLLPEGRQHEERSEEPPTTGKEKQ